MDAGDKRLNEMNRLGDMGHFPPAVNAGATVNVLVTVAVTWLIVARRFPFALGLWIAAVLALNLLPVVLLRLTLRPDTEYPTLRSMNFLRDQHKFSDWVYVAASTNMAFWIGLTWTVRTNTPCILQDQHWGMLAVLLLVAAVATFSPVPLRVLRRRG